MKLILPTLALSLSFIVNANTNVNVTYEKALSSFQANKLGDAEIHIKNILKENNAHLPTRMLFAELLVKKGNGGAAEVELEFAQANGVDRKRTIPLLAEAYLLQFKFQEALSLTSTTFEDSRLQSQMLLLKGKAHLGLRQLVAAERAFDNALEVKANYQDALLGRAQVSIARGKNDEALSYVNRALNSYSPSANAWLLKASILQKQKHFEESLIAIDKAIDIEPENFLSRLTRATLLINRNEYDKAEKDISKVLESIPNEPRAKYLKAILMANTNQFAKASDAINEVIATISAVPDEIMKATPAYYFLAGQANFNYGNYAEARRYLENYLKVERDDLLTTKMIAAIDIELGEYLSAIRVLGKVNLLYPNEPNVLSLLGIAHRGLGDLDKSIYYFELVAKIVPNSAHPIKDLAETKMLQGKYNDVIESLSNITATDVKPIEIKLLLIDSYIGSGRLTNAKTLIEELLQDHKKNDYLLVKLANVLARQGEYSQAKEIYNQVLKITPDNKVAKIQLVRLESVGNPSAALKLLDAYIAGSERDPILLSEKARLLLKVNNVAESLRLFEKSYLLEKDNEMLMRQFVGILFTEQQFDKAIDVIDEFLGRQPESEEGFKLLSKAFKQTNQLDKAIVAQQEVTKLARNKASAYLKLGNLMLEADKAADAMRSFNKAIAWDEKYVPAYISITKLAIELEDLARAKDAINFLKSIESEATTAAVLEADLFIAENKIVDAKKQLISVMQLSPNKRALLKLHQLFFNQKEYQLAKEYLSTWLKKNPNDILVELAFVDTLHANGEIDAAKTVYTALVNKYPNSPAVLNNAAFFYNDIGTPQDAIKLALKANELSSKNVNFMDTLASAYNLNNEPEKALSIYRKALLVDFSNPVLNYKIALTLNKLGRQSEAKKHLIDAVESTQTFDEQNQAKELLEKWIKK